jgi:hypothetical protein
LQIKLPWDSGRRIHKCMQGPHETQCQKQEIIAWASHLQSAGYLLEASIPRCLLYLAILSWIRTRILDTVQTTIKEAMEKDKTNPPPLISTSGRLSRRTQLKWPPLWTSSSICHRENLYKREQESKSLCFLPRRIPISCLRCWQGLLPATRTTLAKGLLTCRTRAIRYHICSPLTMEVDFIISNKWLQTSKTLSTTTTSKLTPRRWVGRHRPDPAR